MKVPKYYIQGDKRSSVHHARLRNNCSNLNHDLFINHLKPISNCDCGDDVEDAEQYFFKCQRYVEQRLVLFDSNKPFHYAIILFRKFITNGKFRSVPRCALTYKIN